jgi:hypothetical protein
MCTHLTDPFLADFYGKHQPKSVPPKSNRFVAHVDAALFQKILNISERKRKRKLDVQHHCQADDLGARLEISIWAAFCHQATPRRHTARLKQICSDKAMWTHCYLTAKNPQSLLRSAYRRPAGGIGGHKVIKVGKQPFAAHTMNVGFREIEPNLCFSNFHYIEVGSALGEADPPIGNCIFEKMVGFTTEVPSCLD